MRCYGGIEGLLLTISLEGLTGEAILNSGDGILGGGRGWLVSMCYDTVTND